MRVERKAKHLATKFKKKTKRKIFPSRLVPSVRASWLVFFSYFVGVSLASCQVSELRRPRYCTAHAAVTRICRPRISTRRSIRFTPRALRSGAEDPVRRTEAKRPPSKLSSSRVTLQHHGDACDRGSHLTGAARREGLKGTSPPWNRTACARVLDAPGGRPRTLAPSHASAF